MMMFFRSLTHRSRNSFAEADRLPRSMKLSIEKMSRRNFRMVR